MRLAVLLPLCLVYLLCLLLHLPCLHAAYYCVVAPHRPDYRTPSSATPGRCASHEATRLLRWRPVRGDGSVHRHPQPATSHPYSPPPLVILRAARAGRDARAYHAHSSLAAVVDAKAHACILPATAQSLHTPRLNDAAPGVGARRPAVLPSPTGDSVRSGPFGPFAASPHPVPPLSESGP